GTDPLAPDAMIGRPGLGTVGLAAGATTGLDAGLSYFGGAGTARGGVEGTVPGLSGPVAPDSVTSLAARRQPQPTQITGERRLDELTERAGQAGRPGTPIPAQHVGPDGAISVPYAGRVVVVGRTPAEAQHQIEALLSPKALDPQVLVMTKAS